MQETSRSDIEKATLHGNLARVQEIIEGGFDLNTKYEVRYETDSSLTRSAVIM